MKEIVSVCAIVADPNKNMDLVNLNVALVEVCTAHCAIFLKK